MGFFSNALGQLTLQSVVGQIMLNFELVRDIMVVQHNCKNEGDPIKKEGARVLTRIFVVVVFFFRC